MSRTITLTEEEYLILANDSEILRHLEEGGVSDWDWYGESLDNFQEMQSFEDVPWLIDGDWNMDNVMEVFKNDLSY